MRIDAERQSTNQSTPSRGGDVSNDPQKETARTESSASAQASCPAVVYGAASVPPQSLMTAKLGLITAGTREATAALNADTRSSSLVRFGCGGTIALALAFRNGPAAFGD